MPIVRPDSVEEPDLFEGGFAQMRVDELFGESGEGRVELGVGRPDVVENEEEGEGEDPKGVCGTQGGAPVILYREANGEFVFE